LAIIAALALPAFAWASYPAEVARTGQTACYDEIGNGIPCTGTGQDGDIQAGVAWPSPRFVDNSGGSGTTYAQGATFTMGTGNIVFSYDFGACGSYNNIYVIWAENSAKNFYYPIYICNRLLGIGGALANTVLPYWKVNKYPHMKQSDIDAVTGATVQKADVNLSFSLPADAPRQFTVYFETDVAYNKNDWFSDQPAILYKADIDLDNPQSGYELVFSGWTPNEGTAGVISGAAFGKLQSETRYITNLKDATAPDGFGLFDSRSQTGLVGANGVRVSLAAYISSTTTTAYSSTTTVAVSSTTTVLVSSTTTTVAAPVGVFKDDFNGDANSDILLKNASGSLYVLAGKDDGVAYGVPARIYKESTPASYSVVGTGDFNGDGNCDILLKNAAGSLYVLFGKDDGVAYATAATRIYRESTPATYSVVGTGDFNGDTHCDILLKNAAGSLYVLYGKADGVSYATTATRIYKESTPATYSVAGTGDFNGDGNCDVLLKNAAGSLFVLLGKNNGVSYAATPTRIYKESTPATYSVVGTGDFNGDGNDDVLLKNAAGSLYVLFGKDDGVAYAATATRIYKETSPATYTAVLTGDYNGDGNTDVLLKNAAGSLYVLFGKDDGVAYATAATRIYRESTPATYSVVGY